MAEQEMRRKVSVLAFLVTLVACSLSLGNRIAFEVDDGVIKLDVDWRENSDFPIFKKYGVMNSGLLNANRYNQTIFDALAAMKADALIVDLYMGSANDEAGFRWTMGGFPGAIVDGQNSVEGVVYNFTMVDILARGLHNAKVWPYWAYTYAPDPFQPKLIEDAAGNWRETAHCPGFEDDPEHYECIPQPLDWSNCWKCPPKDPFGGGYTAYEEVSKIFAAHWKDLQIPVLQEVWNEPDLTEYYDLPTIVSMFIGTSKDYVDMYLAAAKGMLAGDPDTMIGGPGVAYNIGNDRSKFPNSQRPNGGDMMVGAANHSMPVDFFTFHDVNPCMDEAVCNVTEVFETRSAWSRLALTQPEMLDPKQMGRFNVTEIHCTEYHPTVRREHQMLPFSASPALSIMMLNDFKTYLMETDVTKVTWAQYMEVDVAGNGTGLVDYYGNARPSWHSFKFWGDLPIERKSASSSDGLLNILSGFDDRNCYGSILVWNNGSDIGTASINISGIPYDTFDIHVFRLDDDNMPGAGFELKPTTILRGQKAHSGQYFFPPQGESIEIPISGTMFLNITADACEAHGNSHLPLPEGVVLKMHHYFGFRPKRTNLYNMFDRRNWAAYLGMGDEPSGWAIAGATVRVPPHERFNISMNILDGTVQEGGICGIKIEYWDDIHHRWDPESAIMFYDHRIQMQVAKAWMQKDVSVSMMQELVQLPPVFGSKANVSATNFIPRQMDNFIFSPGSSNYRAPHGWRGKLMMLFVLKDGSHYSKVHAYVRSEIAPMAIEMPRQELASTVVQKKASKGWRLGGRR